MSHININDIPIGTIITSDDFNILEVNDTILNILEYTASEISSTSFQLLCNSDSEYQNLYKQLKNKKKLNRFDIKLIQNGGKIIDCTLSAKTIDGQPVRYIFSVEYSTKKNDAGIIQINTEKASNESEEKFKVSFQNYPDPVYISTIPNGKFIDVNNSFEKISGYTCDEVIGKTSEQLNFYLKPEDRTKLFDELNKSKRLVKYEISFRTKSGKILETLVSSEFIKIKGQLCLLSVISDVTGKKQAEFIKDITYNISNAVVSTSNLKDFLKKIRFELGRKINISNFYIALYDKKTDTLSTPYLVDEKDSFTSWPAKKTLTGYVVKKQKPLFITKPEILELVNAKEINLVGTVSEIWIGIPLSIEGKTVGAMVVQDYNNPHAFSTEDFEILKFVSHQISIS
ncbi:MAG: PAS domain S-box protein, partial [Mariniphaga sp.]|nr:PAS domain S-box protein [Mariniphaga sp.]